MFRAMLSVLALLALLGCDAPQAGESLTSDALRNRLSDHRITFSRPSRGRAVWMDLRRDGTGQLQYLENGRTVEMSPFRWDIRDGQLCAADAGEEFECAITTIDGTAVTVAWDASGNRSRVLRGRLSPLTS